MNRVYLLLRNNKQSGPHSLDELLNLGLKAVDLIWVEGKSFGWSYPTEITDLKPHVEPAPETPSSLKETNSGYQPVHQTAYEAYMPPEVSRDKFQEPAPTSRKIYVSMPAANVSAPANVKMPAENGNPNNNSNQDEAKRLEQKADELRKKILAGPTENKIDPKTDIAVDTDNAKMLEQKAEALRKKVMAYASENKTNSKTDNAVDTDEAKKLEQKAEALRNRILAQTPENKTTPKTDNAVDPDEAKKLEQKAEALRNRILAQTPENITNSKTESGVDPDEAKKLEQKAEALRNKILAQTPGNITNSKSDNGVDPDEAKKLEQKAEALRNRILAQTPENITNSKTNNAVDTDEAKKLEQKAEALKKKVLGATPENKNNSKSENSIDAEEAKRLERKAEDLRKKVLAYIPENKPHSKTEKTASTKYSSTVHERAGEYSSWIYNQNAKRTQEARKRWAAIAIIAFLIVAFGVGISFYPFHKKAAIVSTPTVTPEVKKQATEPATTIIENVPKQPLAENNINTNSHPEPAKKIDLKTSSNANIPSKAVNTPKETITPKETKTAKETKTSKDTKETSKAIIAAPDVSKEAHLTRRQRRALARQLAAASKAEEIAAAKAAKDAKTLAAKETKTALKETNPPPKESKTPAKNEAETASAAPKKKKSLSDKVDAFFSKFSNKKEEATPAEEPPANVSTAPGTTERKAIHRDDAKQPVAATPAPPPVATINLADFVKITSNKPSEEWMLGVHGLKVSLHNTSTETVKSAEVEMRYYTEQNEVLDKKIVSFTNVPPGKTITLPAPDHRLADHADFRLIAVK